MWCTSLNDLRSCLPDYKLSLLLRFCNYFDCASKWAWALFQFSSCWLVIELARFAVVYEYCIIIIDWKNNKLRAFLFLFNSFASFSFSVFVLFNASKAFKSSPLFDSFPLSLSLSYFLIFVSLCSLEFML